MTDNVQELVMPDHPEYIELSQEAKNFKSSLFGRYLLDKAAVEAGNAARDLCDVDPDDKTKIIKLQNDAKRLKDLNKWINEAIQIGNAEYADYQSKLSGSE